DSLGGILHAVVVDEIRPPAQAAPLLPVAGRGDGRGGGRGVAGVGGVVVGSFMEGVSDARW
ncbi:hypothetical protein AB0885_44385, partial [Streptomyces sp. NPDC005534]|uniref:hypothetical protein n=1 Tax=Streptomyces sp. NPDC005534 TaxID=3155714 RepID=UPI003456C2C5